MNKKKFIKTVPAEDLKGFEEFVEGQPEPSFLGRPAVNGNKKETSFEHFTFLTTDAERLLRLKNLLNEKLPFTVKYQQGQVLIKEQREEVQALQKKIFEVCDKTGSAYRKSIQEIFDPFFEPHEPTT